MSVLYPLCSIKIIRKDFNYTDRALNVLKNTYLLTMVERDLARKKTKATSKIRYIVQSFFFRF